MTRLEIKVPNWLDRICALPVMAYRRIRYGYSFRRIPLGEDKFTIVDQQDFYRFNNFNWCCEEDGWNTYAVRIAGVPKKKIKILSLHREIMNHPKGFLVDHRNNNGLDNRRENLRKATKSQNVCNRRKKANTTSKFIGVHFAKRNGLWASYITHRRKQIWLGYFKSEVEAARVRDIAAKKYHGEFARLNFPENV